MYVVWFFINGCNPRRYFMGFLLHIMRWNCIYCGILFTYFSDGLVSLSLDRPGMIDNVTTTITAKNITISWNRPLDEVGRDLRVVIQYQPMFGDKHRWHTVDAPIGSTSYTIAFTALTTVKFKLRALNDCGIAGPITGTIARSRSYSSPYWSELHKLRSVFCNHSFVSKSQCNIQLVNLKCLYVLFCLRHRVYANVKLYIFANMLLIQRS